MGSIYWYSKELNIIYTEMGLINQCRGLVKSPAPIGAAVIYVFKFISKAPTPNQRIPIDPLLSLS